MLVLILVGFSVALASWLYLFLERRYSTWKRKGVPGPPASVLDLRVPRVLLGRESMGDVADRVYKEYRDSPVAGSYMFSNPLLHIHDPEIIKHVFIKDFQDFSGRGTGTNPDFDPLSTNIFFLSGQRWRDLRTKLAPSFTSGKIKYMFASIRKSSEQLAEYLSERVAAGGGQHTENARALMSKVFVDTVASVAFGIESNVFRNPNSEFRRAVERAVAPTLANALRNNLSLFGREVLTALRIRTNGAETIDFFRNVVHDTVQYREQNDVERADILDQLIQLKNKGFTAGAETPASGPENKLTMDDIASQVFVFMIAGFDSSSGITSFTLYEIAKNPALQEKTLREVDEVMEKFNGQITYETVSSMPFLDKMISETLRKYPPLSFLTREAMVTRKVPLTDVVIEKGTRLVIPLRALHYDPQYWPDPEKYDPERFSEENKGTRPTHAYFPFGDGPRICIAARLGVVQVKTALLTLLSMYSVSLASSSPGKVPLNPLTFGTTPQDSLDVCFHLRDTKAADAVRARIANKS